MRRATYNARRFFRQFTWGSMMKRLALTVALTAVLVNVPSVASANAQISTNLCNYVAADDKKRLRKYLKAEKLKLRNIFGSVVCNGKNLLDFAASKNAVKAGSLIISKLPKSVVSANMAAVQSNAELAAAADKRVNG